MMTQYRSPPNTPALCADPIVPVAPTFANQRRSSTATNDAASVVQRRVNCLCCREREAVAGKLFCKACLPHRNLVEAFLPC
jgi:hypothetical protein